MHLPLILSLALLARPETARPLPVVEPAPEPQPDVTRIVRLSREIWRAPSDNAGAKAQLLPSLVDALLESCLSVLRDSGLVDGRDARWEELRAELWEQVGARLEGLPSDPRPRREALETLLREVTTRAKAVEVLDAWFVLDPPATPRPAVAAREPIEELKSAPPGLTLAAQLSEVGGEAGELQLDPASSSILQEAGLSGANGVLDSGEWVQLKIGLKNASPRPWFSTSATVEARGECVWTDSHFSYEMAELAPGASGGVVLWVYLSRQCAAGKRQLALRFCDSHRTTAPSSTLLVTLNPVELGTPRLVNPSFDSDTCGFSDGSRLTVLKPALRFELAQDLAVPPIGFNAARMRWQSSAEVAPLFKTFAFRDVPMVAEGSSYFRAGDDLDAEVVPEQTYRPVLENARGHRRWIQPPDGRTWLAVDVELELGTPTEPPPKAPACSVPSAGTVVELVKKHLALVPHPIPPAFPDSVHAASGYEVHFDSAEFTQAYEALSLPKQDEPEARAAPLRYRLRFYRPVLLTAFRPSAPALPPPPAPAPVAKPAWRPSRVLRLDVGPAWGVYGTATPPSDPYLWGDFSTIAPFGLDLRLSVGKTFAAVVGFTYDHVRLTGPSPEDAVELTELIGEFGAAWHIRAVERLEISPRLVLEYRGRELRLGTANVLSAPSVNASVGATARYMFLEHVGVYVDARYRLGPQGPSKDDQALLGGSGPHVGFGASFRY